MCPHFWFLAPLLVFGPPCCYTLATGLILSGVNGNAVIDGRGERNRKGLRSTALEPHLISYVASHMFVKKQTLCANVLEVTLQ